MEKIKIFTNRKCYKLDCRNHVWEECEREVACIYHCHCPKQKFRKEMEIADRRKAREMQSTLWNKN